ncbi:alpha/beta hydrolase domain-containing protein [Thalassotalea sp. Y01]|uniref:alpha/beta hydrolase domain-containing protein n=1 Tax=Thalassotalea sp. Y01 TaxID=2729613 RepID=UPI00145E013E|nr:alpha/beta hydrolase domain-containing protein [Thalassotalea sp. Y01]NMP16075.1 hypothetical protein [Thalassotalea sp. Y01]
MLGQLYAGLIKATANVTRLAVATLLVVLPLTAQAKIVANSVKTTKQINFKGQSLEIISGEFEFALDPLNAANTAIVDLQHASKDSDGMVRAKANYVVIQHQDPKLRNGALIEVSNRGSKASLRYFNFAPRSAMPTQASHLGDGLIQEMGMSMIWVGWQGDLNAGEHVLRAQLPKALGQAGWARSDWTVDTPKSLLSLAHRPQIDTVYPVEFSKESQAWLTRRMGRDSLKSVVPRDSWQFSSDGKSIAGNFEPGIYELVYPTKDPLVAGVGLAILRDTADYVKQADSPYQVDKTIAFGVSQTGRFLRHFLYQGFNETEGGEKAFDGMFIHTAGAGRGSFNHRFAQPSRDGHRMTAFFYPTDIFPFTSERVRSSITNKKEGLLKRHHEDFYPNIFYTNTGYEYWGRAAALIHTHDIYDVEPKKNERIYHLASAQHYVEGHQNLNAISQVDNLFQGNPIDFRVQLRALLAHLANWVVKENAPPRSAFPRFANQTLITFSHFQLPPWLPIDKPYKPHTAYEVDYGDHWQQGIIDNQPPVILAEIMPAVPKVDNNGHELGGIKHPLIQAPIATFMPWSLRYNKFASNEISDFRGATLRWSKDKILQRYSDEKAYQNHLKNMSDKSVKSGWLLPRDVSRVLQQGKWLWQWSMQQPKKKVATTLIQDKQDKQDTQDKQQSE